MTGLACNVSMFNEAFTPSGAFLYQETFSTPNSRWDERMLEAGAVGYANDAYRIQLHFPNAQLWSRPGLYLNDVRVEATVLSAGAPESRMGVLCRLVDDQNFYFFVISADGFYGIGKMRAGQASLLTGAGAMLPTDTIFTGNLPNQVRGDCIGKTLTLYVNNCLVDSTADGDFFAGDVGLLAGTSAQPETEVYFDNFFVIKP